jgi:hypothetical protein
LLRRATFVDDVRASAAVVLADAGGAPGGTSDYHQMRFLAILRGEAAMGIAAHNLGTAEAALGGEFLRQAQAETGVPFVSCNVCDREGNLLVEPVHIVEAGGRRVALTGVLSPRLAGASVRVTEPRQAVLGTLVPLREEYDLAVVLAYVSAEELEQLASALPEVEVVVGGPTRQAVAPHRRGPTLVASATNKGKFLVDIREKASLEGLSLAGEIVEIGPDLADHAAQSANLESLYAALADRDFAAVETGLVPALPAEVPDSFRVAGTRGCRDCHVGDCELWEETGHAHAWRTLEEKRSAADPYCQQCHTTGYGLPAGFASMKTSPDRRDVGCENCHGPSAAHVADPGQRTLYVARDRCIHCHDRENSPLFEYDSYWMAIAHGEPAFP